MIEYGTDYPRPRRLHPRKIRRTRSPLADATTPAYFELADALQYPRQVAFAHPSPPTNTPPPPSYTSQNASQPAALTPELPTRPAWDLGMMRDCADRLAL